MAHLNVYIPDMLGKNLAHEAKKRRSSLSKLVVDLIEKTFQPKNKWQDGFFSGVVGKWQGPLPDIERELPEERPDL